MASKCRAFHIVSTLSAILFGVIVIMVLSPSTNPLQVRAATDNPYGKYVIGIDVGSAYSCVSVWRNGTTEIIPNDEGSRIWANLHEGAAAVGDAVNVTWDTLRDPTVPNIEKNWQRLVCRAKDETEAEAQTSFSQRIVHGREDRSATILKTLKADAEAYLGEPVTHAVVAVPSYYNDAQRQSTKDAGAVAGLTVLRVINEPTAASIAYKLNDNEGERWAVVYDLGARSLDVTLLFIEDGVFEIFADSHDLYLGGDNFTERVMDHFLVHREEQGVTGSSRAQLKRAAEWAKRALSMENIAHITDPQSDYVLSLSRASFETINEDLFLRTLKHIDTVLRDANLTKNAVDDILLVGGSTRIPKIQELVTEYFGRAPLQSISPDEAAALGAGIQGGVLNNDDVTDCCCCFEVISLALGIEVTGGVVAPLIVRNSIIPNRKSQVFSTATDNQTSVSVKLFRGQRALAQDQDLVATVELTGIPPAPHGEPEIEVTVEVDAGYMVTLTATNLASGAAKFVTVPYSTERLDQDYLDRTIKEAEGFADEDDARRLSTFADEVPRKGLLLKPVPPEEPNMAQGVQTEHALMQVPMVI